MRATVPELGRRSAPRQIASSASPALDGEEGLVALLHDLNNNAVAALRNLEILEAGLAGPLSGAQRDVIQATGDCLRLVLGLAGELPEWNRPLGGPRGLLLDHFDMADAVHAAIRASRGAALPRRIAFKFVPACAAAPVRADRNRIVRVVVNLLLNAADHSPDGSAVRITCERRREGVVVAVTDDGCGIPREHQERVFEKHYRIVGNGGARNHDGSGLGLWFCRSTIEAHGGRIWIESPPAGRSRGTRALFSLPPALEVAA